MRPAAVWRVAFAVLAAAVVTIIGIGSAGGAWIAAGLIGAWHAGWSAGRRRGRVEGGLPPEPTDPRDYRWSASSGTITPLAAGGAVWSPPEGDRDTDAQLEVQVRRNGRRAQ